MSVVVSCLLSTPSKDVIVVPVQVDWKLTRGTWRPRLLDFAKQHSQATVKAASEAAVKALEAADKPASRDDRDAHASPDERRVRAALKPLTELKGIGPATASALLAVVHPMCPFMSDELLQAVFGAREYTVKQYVQLVQEVGKKARQLSEKGRAGSHSSDGRLLRWRGGFVELAHRMCPHFVCMLNCRWRRRACCHAV